MLFPLAALVLAACIDAPQPRGDVIDVQEIRRLSVCNSSGGDIAVSLLPDRDAVLAWQRRRGVDLIGRDPLPYGPFALIELGARSGAGYGLVVNRKAGLNNGVLRLSATFLAPQPEQVAAQTVTSPCLLVALPPTRYRGVRLVDGSGMLRAQADEPVLPTAPAAEPLPVPAFAEQTPPPAPEPPPPPPPPTPLGTIPLPQDNPPPQ